MNNNRRRAIERRRHQRRERQRTGQPAADPLSAPLPPSERCAVCRTSPATTHAEIGTSGKPSLFIPLCRGCVADAPACLQRMGFVAYREMIVANMRQAS